MVASCSFDNSVIVFDAQTGQKLQTLKGHSNLVKGIAWDPVGKYLATKSDDQSVIIWRAGDWAIEAILTDPFQTHFESLFAKVSWAPDGSFLAASHASDHAQPVGAIFPRGKWQKYTSIVGHHQLITAVVRPFSFSFFFLFFSLITFFQALSPVLYKAEGHSEYFMCYAVASMDHSLSIWHSSTPRPMAIIANIATQSLVDLSWFVILFLFFSPSSFLI